MTTITARSAHSESSIRIGAGLLDETATLLAPFISENAIHVVSDERVWALQGHRLIQALPGVRLFRHLVPPGEGSKSWHQLQRLVDTLLDEGIHRGRTVVAFGGGVVGDLAGLAAALVHRGCRLVQIPTTLLAQVDSSVGSKTAINAGTGKNQIGTFHTAELVLIDPTLLKTLPQEHLKAGYAEMLKIALINQPYFFEWLDQRVAAVLGLDMDALTQAIVQAVRGKLALVTGDEADLLGQRMLLNFGHSFAHAIESRSDFRIAHGMAVAVGMSIAFRISERLGNCKSTDVALVQRHMRSAGLPTTLTDLGLAHDPGLWIHLSHDKKVMAGEVRFILTKGIGEAFIDRVTTAAQLAPLLRDCA